MNEQSKARRVAVVVPVYCERDSLQVLVPEIFAQPLGSGLEVWIVDDSSPDHTADVINDMRASFAGLHLLQRRRPEGRGEAVVEAFRLLLDGGAGGLAPDIFVEMDGDGSHDPADLAELIKASAQADVVLGSRGVEGGGAEMSGSRRFLSKLANGFARLVLGLPYRDCSTGYRCYRRQVLDALDIDALRCGGHATHLEMLYRLHQAGARVAEVPIYYHARRGGFSKVTLRETLRVAIVLLRIRLGAAQRRATVRR